MENVEALTARLEKAKEVFRQMKAEAAEKDATIADLNNRVAETEDRFAKATEAYKQVKADLDAANETNENLTRVNTHIAERVTEFVDFLKNELNIEM